MNFFFIEEILLDIIDEKISPIKCDECNRAFTSKSNLKRHNVRMHEVDFFVKKHFLLAEELKKVNTCESCDKTFKDKSNFNKHILTHENVQYSCNYCDQQYRNKASLIRHIKVHDTPEMVKCEKCH